MFGFTSQEEFKAKLVQLTAVAFKDFGPPKTDTIEHGPGVPYKAPPAVPRDSLDEMQPWQRLQFLVWSCDYRGSLIPASSGCGCGGGGAPFPMGQSKPRRRA